MAMEKKGFKDVSADLKTNYQKALDALSKKNTDYGIMLLKGIIQKEPCFVDAREQLRKAEKALLGNAGFMKKTMAKIKTSGIVAAGKALLAAKKPLDAMKKAEDALAISVVSLPALNLLAQAASELGATFIAIEALETAREYYPKNCAVLDWLATVYADDRQGVKALRIRQEIAAMKPNDLDVQQKVRAAAALASMEQGKWTEGEDYRTKLKNEDEAVKLEQEDRIARNVDDVAELIVEYEKQFNGGKQTLDIKRKLADLYQKAERHDDAIKFFNMVVEEMGTLDPHIDHAIEKSNVAKFDSSINEWKRYAGQNPDKRDEAEKNIAGFDQEKLSYRLERALDRVNKYPNDLQLRYELALVHWDNGDVDNSLQQFQLSQKNPQRRLSSIVYLGRCFCEKQQYDIAVEQFNKAVSEMIAMDKQKMAALYYLGISYERMQEKEKALKCYKEIYQANIKYKDVAEKLRALAQK
jgi:tetratricopeptide (TPR) repeat protein